MSILLLTFHATALFPQLNFEIDCGPDKICEDNLRVDFNFSGSVWRTCVHVTADPGPGSTLFWARFDCSGLDSALIRFCSGLESALFWARIGSDSVLFWARFGSVLGSNRLSSATSGLDAFSVLLYAKTQCMENTDTLSESKSK